MGGIRETYRLTKKTPDLPWNTYVCRPVAAVLVHLLRDTRVTPNQITLTSFLVALVSAALLVGLPGYLGLVVAVLVFEGSYVLDCADGMLARLRGTSSTAGHLLDFLMDEIKAFVVLGAVSVRLYLAREDALYLLIGIAGLVCLASGIAVTTFQRRPEIAGNAKGAAPRRSREPTPVQRVVGLAERVGRLLIHYPSYILLAALAGRIELYFFPYVVVNALYFLRAFTGVALRFGKGGA